MFTEHDSVEQSRRLQTEPIDLYECFKAFTKEEELGEDELWSVYICHILLSSRNIYTKINVRHLGLILDLINYDFDDVRSWVNHLKILQNDRVTIQSGTKKWLTIREASTEQTTAKFYLFVKWTSIYKR